MVLQLTGQKKSSFLSILCAVYKFLVFFWFLI